MNATTLPGVQIGTNGGGSSVSKGTERQSRDSADPCPCVNCDTQKVYETRYLSKTKKRDDDVQVTVRRKMFVCGGNNTVKVECEEELKRLRPGASNSGGMNGLSCNCAKPSYNYESRM